MALAVEVDPLSPPTNFFGVRQNNTENFPAGMRMAMAIPLLGMVLLPLGQTRRTFSDQAIKESLTPIRAGFPGRAPYWNENAKQFMVAPAFDFKPIAGAKSYRFTVVSDGGVTNSFEASEPYLPLTPIWADVPVGSAKLRVEGLSQRGGDLVGLAGERQFHRAAVFKGPYGPRKRGQCSYFII